MIQQILLWLQSKIQKLIKTNDSVRLDFIFLFALAIKMEKATLEGCCLGDWA